MTLAWCSHMEWVSPAESDRRRTVSHESNKKHWYYGSGWFVKGKTVSARAWRFCPWCAKPQPGDPFCKHCGNPLSLKRRRLPKAVLSTDGSP